MVNHPSMQYSRYMPRFPWWFSDRKTPVPIPNTAEKTVRSNNTWTGRSWKDSFLPRVYLKKSTVSLAVLFLWLVKAGENCGSIPKRDEEGWRAF